MVEHVDGDDVAVTSNEITTVVVVMGTIMANGKINGEGGYKMFIEMPVVVVPVIVDTAMQATIAMNMGLKMAMVLLITWQ
jgi:hypothetical protein